MRTVAIIPARGGSKGIPRKNILPFCGYPLIAWTVACARACDGIKEVIVSTNCSTIAQVASNYGARVVLRPEEISTDQAPSEAALIHAVEEVEREHAGAIEQVVFLQATSPLREPAEVSGALARFESGRLDSLFCAAALEDALIWREDHAGFQSLNYDFRNRKRRQEKEITHRDLIETGSFYITTRTNLMSTRNRLGGTIGVWLVPFWKSFEIDSIDSFNLCETLMKTHRLDAQPPPLISQDAATL